NGSRWRAEEAAIEAGWKFLCSKQGDLAFSEVLIFVRERVPGVDLVRVREGFLRRLRERGGELWNDPAPDLSAPRVDAVIHSNGEETMRKYAKGGDVRVQKDRARGGAVLQPTASKFVKPEVLHPQASRFEREPDPFRTNIQRSDYGPKKGTGGELGQTEGE